MTLHWFKNKNRSNSAALYFFCKTYVRAKPSISIKAAGRALPHTSCEHAKTWVFLAHIQDTHYSWCPTKKENCYSNGILSRTLIDRFDKQKTSYTHTFTCWWCENENNLWVLCPLFKNSRDIYFRNRWVWLNTCENNTDENKYSRDAKRERWHNRDTFYI